MSKPKVTGYDILVLLPSGKKEKIATLHVDGAVELHQELKGFEIRYRYGDEGETNEE